MKFSTDPKPFRNFLNESTNLLTILGICNALIAYCISLAPNKMPVDSNRISAAFSMGSFIISLLCIWELAAFTARSFNKLEVIKYVLFFASLAFIQYSIGCQLYSQHKTFMVFLIFATVAFIIWLIVIWLIEKYVQPRIHIPLIIRIGFYLVVWVILFNILKFSNRYLPPIILTPEQEKQLQNNTQ